MHTAKLAKYAVLAWSAKYPIVLLPKWQKPLQTSYNAIGTITAIYTVPKRNTLARGNGMVTNALVSTMRECIANGRQALASPNTVDTAITATVAQLELVREHNRLLRRKLIALCELRTLAVAKCW